MKPVENTLIDTPQGLTIRTIHGDLPVERWAGGLRAVGIIEWLYRELGCAEYCRWAGRVLRDVEDNHVDRCP